jgi:uncharacterized MAPEG superfamily protein
MSIPVWSLLAFGLWTVLVLALGVGVHRWSLILTGRAELKQFPGDEAHGPAFYRRAVRAHANCVENLPVFTAIVAASEWSGVGGPMIDGLSATVVAARALQTITHLSSGSNKAVAMRFAFFAIQLLCFVWMGALVVQHALQ